MSLITGMSYITPILGAIRLGQVVERKGKRLPTKNDFFTITENYKQAGEWVNHPLNDALIKDKTAGAEQKLTSIPVKVLYSRPELNVSERYEAYDRENKRLVCAGNGKTAKQLDGYDIKEVGCLGPDHCKFGKDHHCSVFGRAMFKIEGQSDAFGGFIVRYGSYNGVNALRTKIEALAAAFGEKLPYVKLRLVLRAKSSAISMNSVFYYPDIEVDGDLVAVAQDAKDSLERAKAAGLEMQAAENRIAELLQNGRFEIDCTETFDDREEFLPPEEGIEVIGEGATGNADGAVRVTVQPMSPRGRKGRMQASTSLGDLTDLIGALPQKEPNTEVQENG